VFIAAFVVHVALKLGTMRRSLRTRTAVMNLAARPDPGEASLTAIDPAPATMSRRALLGTVAAGSVLLFLQGVGQSAGGPFRALAFLLPRGRTRPGPLGFPVNKTWVASGVAPRAIGSGWQLRLTGARSVSLSRAQLLALPQHTCELPIACVEGWSTTQRWSGVRLADLAALCGVSGPATLTTHSLEQGLYGHATLGHEQVADTSALLALAVNGRELPLDHGYPARVIAPGIPGVHCTKWVASMSFGPVPA
jgi:DMSO/TMAO reductase YedYZ molybdopterin-dependent catalytic subunit